MTNNQDHLLINQYLQGDEKALTQLINIHQKELYAFIYYKLLDEDLANDFFQDVFVKIIITLKENKYQDEGKFIVWAKRIAQNMIIDHFRAKSKRRFISETTNNNQEFSVLDFISDTSYNKEDEMVLMQIHEDLRKLITLLPKDQQEIIKMRYFEGKSFKEIANELNISINTSLGRVRYATIRLRKLMEENHIILSIQ